MEKYNSRSEVPEKYKWDLSSFFKDEKDFLNTCDEIEKLLVQFDKYHDCFKDANKVFEYIELDVKTACLIMDLCCYATTKNDEELGNAKNVDNLNKVNALDTKYCLASSFFEPELLKLSEEEYENLFKNCKKLNKYRKYLDNLYRYKEHHLSEEEEKIVNMLTQTMSSYSNMSTTLLNNNNDYGKVVLENGEEEVLSLTNYRKLMKKSSREKRKEIYEQLNKVLDQYSSTSASILNNYVTTKEALAKIYNFNDSWEFKLFGFRLNNDVFDALIKGTEERLDVLKKYREIKAKNNNLDELMPWDDSLDFYKSDKEYSIEEANKLVLAAIKPLGEDYTNRFKKVLNGGNIDYCQYKGKYSGGYNISSINQANSKILMSFNGDLTSVSTIAHEGGHHVNHQYLYENNEPIYRYHSSMVAEVASLTNECLLSSYLAKQDDKEQAKNGISNIVSVINSNLVGAVLEGNVERKMYDIVNKGGSLTNEILNSLVEEEIKKYYGLSELKHKYQRNSWITRSHYYMFFYLYSYAICISVASFVAKNILEGNKEMLNNYLEFLKCGSNKTIEEAFEILGVDLTDKNVYTSAMDYMDNLLDEFIKIKDGEVDV